MPTAEAQGRVDDPVDAALRPPHAAVLVGWALGFTALLSLLSLIARVRIGGATAATVGVMVLLILVCSIGAFELIRSPRWRSLPAALAGIVVLDVAAPALQIAAASTADARTRVTVLILPTMIAAATLGRRYLRVHLVVAVLLGVAMLSVTPDGRTTLDRGVEIVLFIGTLVAGAYMVRGVSAATQRHVADLRRLALTDKLTGALNRRGLADDFRSARKRWARQSVVGVLSLDIDHFKWFNDTYGHPAGDEVLKLVCKELANVAGADGLVARTGGEELVAIVPGPAEPVAKAFRERLAATDEPRVTVSIGIVDTTISEYDGPDFLWQVLDAADKAMYTAKTTGRDRVCRGTLDRQKKVRPPLAPAPQHAAVPPPDMETASSSGPFPGWILTVLSVVGVIAGVVRPSPSATDLVGQIYLPIMMMCLIFGVILIGMGPLMDRFRWAVGVIGSDLVILVEVVDLDDAYARLLAIVPLLLTGLMVAQHFSRRPLLVHHALIVAICMLAPLPDTTLSTLALALLGAAVLISSTELIFFLQQRNRAAATDLHRWSVTDPLTNLANRHGLELGFENLSRAQQLTVLALDVDDFKGINDTYGHAAGDDALVRLAHTLRAVTTEDTVVCRTGGDEFVVLAPNVRPSALTSKVKRAAALLPLPLSVSIGSAVAAPHRLRSLWQLVDAADAALIRAKRSRKQQRRVTRPDYFEEIVSEDGSSTETSTETVSPSVMDPARSWRAS